MVLIGDFNGNSEFCIVFLKNFRENEIIINFSNMSKVFRDFSKINPMNKGLLVGIVIAVVIGIITISVVSMADSNVMEVEDTLDKEIKPEETQEIKDKLDEIEEIADKNEYEPLPRDWQTSGPFQIDRKEYAIGEKIFLRTGEIDFEEKGQVAVMRPKNSTHYSVYLTIPFDGLKKEAFNYYVEPQISKTRGICSIDDLMGRWALVFRGTDYPNLYFNITDRIVPGTNVEPVC